MSLEEGSPRAEGSESEKVMGRQKQKRGRFKDVKDLVLDSKYTIVKNE